jgi:serine/threonine protein kinase
MSAISFHLAKFIAHFHANNQVINDVKPSRIFVTSEGHFKMFTYTMSQLFQKRIARCKSALKGAPYYLAPEVTALSF